MAWSLNSLHCLPRATCGEQQHSPHENNFFMHKVYREELFGLWLLGLWVPLAWACFPSSSLYSQCCLKASGEGSTPCSQLQSSIISHYSPRLPKWFIFLENLWCLPARLNKWWYLNDAGPSKRSQASQIASLLPHGNKPVFFILETMGFFQYLNSFLCPVSREMIFLTKAV